MNATALNDTVLHHPALDDTVEYRVGRSQPVAPPAQRYEAAAPAAHQCPGCRRRLAIGLVWVAVVLMGIGAGAWLADQWREPARGAAEAGGLPSAAASATASATPEKPQGPQVAQPVLPQDTQPSGPCDGASGQWVVESNPVHLEPGATMGSVVVHHCGEGDVGWWAQSKPYVSLEHTAGDLGEGASLTLKFTVDPSGLPPGAYSFKIKVSQPSASVYITVHGSH